MNAVNFVGREWWSRILSLPWHCLELGTSRETAWCWLPWEWLMLETGQFGWNWPGTPGQLRSALNRACIAGLMWRDNLMVPYGGYTGYTCFHFRGGYEIRSKDVTVNENGDVLDFETRRKDQKVIGRTKFVVDKLLWAWRTLGYGPDNRSWSGMAQTREEAIQRIIEWGRP